MVQRARLAGEDGDVLFAAGPGRCGPAEAPANATANTELVEAQSSGLRVSNQREGPLW